MSDSVLDSELSEVLDKMEIQSEDSSRSGDVQESEISDNSDEDESFD